MTHRLIKLALVSTLLIGAPALAQPGSPPPPRPEDEPLAGPRTNDEPSREEMERVLADRLAQLDRERATLEQAMTDLKAGRDVDLPGSDRAQRSRERFRDRETGPGGGPDGEPREPLTEAQREQVMAFLKEHDPRLYERFSEMIDRRPELAERLMQRFGRRALDMAQLKEDDPERFELRVRAMRAEGEIREVITEAVRNNALDAPETRRTLAQLVAARLDDQQAEHADEIERLSARIGELREQMRLEVENRSQKIDEMVGRIIDKAKEFRDNPPERFERGGRGDRGDRGEREGRGTRDRP